VAIVAQGFPVLAFDGAGQSEAKCPLPPPLANEFLPLGIIVRRAVVAPGTGSGRVLDYSQHSVALESMFNNLECPTSVSIPGFQAAGAAHPMFLAALSGIASF